MSGSGLGKVQLGRVHDVMAEHVERGARARASSPS